MRIERIETEQRMSRINKHKASAIDAGNFALTQPKIATISEKPFP